jgi:hypothetical protein
MRRGELYALIYIGIYNLQVCKGICLYMIILVDEYTRMTTTLECNLRVRHPNEKNMK